jgi:hypothetical protein
MIDAAQGFPLRAEQDKARTEHQDDEEGLPLRDGDGQRHHVADARDEEGPAGRSPPRTTAISRDEGRQKSAARVSCSPRTSVSATVFTIAGAAMTWSQKPEAARRVTRCGSDMSKAHRDRQGRLRSQHDGHEWRRVHPHVRRKISVANVVGKAAAQRGEPKGRERKPRRQ